jgi:CheY-like chemotaxis protein
VSRLAFHDDPNFKVEGASSAAEGLKLARESSFDIFVLDIQLQQGQHNGIWIAQQLRDLGMSQPIILVTGAKTPREWPISRYESILSRGPTYFYDRNAEQPLDDDVQIPLLADVIRQAAGQTDILMRALRVVKAAGITQSKIKVDGFEITADDLLTQATLASEGEQKTAAVQKARIMMRESMQAMLALSLESHRRGRSGVKA